MPAVHINICYMMETWKQNVIISYDLVSLSALLLIVWHIKKTGNWSSIAL